MHGLTDETEQLAHQVLELVLARQRQDPWPIGGVATAEELAERVGPTITPDGLGGSEVLRLDRGAGAGHGCGRPSALPRIYSPRADGGRRPLRSACGSLWDLRGVGWKRPERSTPRTTRCAGWPISPASGRRRGAFVPGGTLGNLSALHTARDAALRRRGGVRPARWQIATSEAHSSVAQAARVLDVDVIDVPVDGVIV